MSTQSKLYSAVHKLGKKMADALLTPVGLQLRVHPDRRPFPFPEATDKEIALCQEFARYTRTDQKRQWTFLKAVEYIDRQEIPGDIVECGVWRGGNVMMAKKARRESPIARKLWMYDTFTGMSEASQYDIGNDGTIGKEFYDEHQKDSHNEWCYASLEEVKGGFRENDLLGDDLVFRQGLVEDTLRSSDLPDRISLLRLDTIFYESTKVELEVLYPRLSSGGVVIIDDYGDWLGARKAASECFGNSGPLLLPIDPSLRMGIKV